MKQTWKEIGRNFIMFVLTSSAGTVVDLGVHWLLSNFVFRGNYWGSYWIAPTVSFELAAMTNFIIAYYVLWKDRVTKRTTRSFWRHFAAYNASTLGAYCIKFIAMQGIHFLFVSQNWFQDTSFEPVICNLLALCFSGAFNFLMNEFVIFNKTK